LRETLAAHAEEHMRKLAERERRNSELAKVAAPAGHVTLRQALGRFFGRS
jgi:hypothetical protein